MTDVPDPIVSVQNLSKSFGKVQAVQGVSFDVHPGEIFAFLGPNGAGKSTTINLLCTLLRPSSGTARVAGHDVETDPLAVRDSIGLVFQDRTLDDQLSAEQNLRFHAVLYGVPRHQVDGRITEVLALVGLAERRRDKVRTFSGGMARRLEIARGMLHVPKVLFLDEPTIGLDPQTRARLWDDVRKLRDRGVTVFFTTHYMDEAEYADRIAIMDHGRIVALDTPQNLKRTVGSDRIRLSLRQAPTATQARQLQATFGPSMTVDALAVEIRVKDGGRALAPAVTAASAAGLVITETKLLSPDLDDVFMHYTGRAIRTAAPDSGMMHRMMQRRRRA